MKNGSIFDGYLICTDIDHTLVDDFGNISKENAQAIKYFQQNGGLFTVSTGRVYTHLDNFTNSFKVNTYVIQINGTSIFDTVNKKSVFSCPMDIKTINTVSCALLKNFSSNLILSRACTEHKMFGYNERIENLNEDVFKAVFVFDNEKNCLKAEKYIEDNFSDICAFNRSWHEGLEIINPNSGKGVCVKKLKQLLGDKARCAVCVGDFENDITMLKAADIGYAVSNAIDAVKNVADKITVSNNESAIAAVIHDLKKTIIKE